MKKIREIVMITTEKSRKKKHLENSQYKVDEDVMITNWIQK